MLITVEVRRTGDLATFQFQSRHIQISDNGTHKRQLLNDPLSGPRVNRMWFAHYMGCVPSPKRAFLLNKVVPSSLYRPFQPTAFCSGQWTCFCDSVDLIQMEFSMSNRMSVSVISHHFDHYHFHILNQLGPNVTLETTWWPKTIKVFIVKTIP